MKQSESAASLKMDTFGMALGGKSTFYSTQGKLKTLVFY